tara:strand:+ start:6451 stop:6699 length:249 start_codon:yes stop_codon:yes gene_type:complete
MKNILWATIGVMIGTVFHDDVPLLNNVSGQKVKNQITMLITGVMVEPGPTSEENKIEPEVIETEPGKKKSTRKKRKALRKTQ